MNLPNKIYLFSPFPASSPLEPAFLHFAKLLEEQLETKVEATYDSTIKNITQYFCEQKDSTDKLLLSGFGPSILDPLYTKVDYKPYKDLFYIGQVCKMPILLYAAKDSQYQSFPEIIKYAKRNSIVEIGIGYPLGGSPHFTSAYLASLFKLNIKFTLASVEELMAKKVQFICYHPFTQEQEAVKEHYCTPIVIYNSDNSAYYKQVPSLASLGIAFDLASWRALAAPRNINLAYAKRLSKATKAICEATSFQLVLEQTHETAYWQDIESTRTWIKMQQLYCKSIMPQVKKYM